MKKRWWLLLLVLIIAGLVVATVAFWPWVRAWLPHPALIEAWLHYLVVDLSIGQWGPVVILLLVGLIELIWAVTLGRRSGAYERQWQRLERLHTREIDMLNQKISLLEDERRALQGELDLREDLIHEEKVRLWTQFEELQRASGVSLSRLISLEAPELTPELRGDWRQIIAQLERLEITTTASIRQGQGALRLQQHADELVRLGNACYYLKQYERALTHYSRASDLSATEPEALINHAVVNHVLGRHQPALQELDRALKLSESPWAYLYRGLIRERQGEDKRALEDYVRALRLDANLPEAYYRRGLLYAKTGENDKALQDQNRAIDLNNNHAGAYTARGAARAATGDYQWALSDLDRGCALAPTHPEGFYRRGLVRHGLEMYEEALKDFEQAIDLDSSYAPAFFARGSTYSAIGEYWQAAADYGRAIELQPSNTQAYYARGLARAAMREYRRAIEDLDQALKLDPGMAVALANRGSAYEKLGEYSQAIQDLDRAIALDPNLAIAYYNRGLAYGSMGEYDRASRDLNKAVELDPSLGKERGGAGLEAA
jgi:tetratricopeptide (TPR) repeat protein